MWGVARGGFCSSWPPPGWSGGLFPSRHRLHAAFPRAAEADPRTQAQGPAQLLVLSDPGLFLMHMCPSTPLPAGEGGVLWTLMILVFIHAPVSRQTLISSSLGKSLPTDPLLSTKYSQDRTSHFYRTLQCLHFQN